MPDLHHSLNQHDLGHFRILADFWDVDLDAPDARAALPMMVSALKTPSLIEEMVDGLPEESRTALTALAQNNGWMPWNRFIQKYGQLREVGPGKRDREKPHLHPISTTEYLWYRGLIGRDFLKRGGTLQECVYVPDEFHIHLPSPPTMVTMQPGRAASPGESQVIQPASDQILDHACTLLAALRLGDPKRSPTCSTWTPPYHIVHALLSALKLITSSEQPIPEDAKPFLTMPRGKALAWLVQNWLTSHLFNELRLMPDLTCEGAWQNEPDVTRTKMLSLLSHIPDNAWWSLPAFISWVKENHPNFQRPNGDFDSWIIRDAETGQSLKGFENWESVEGALIRFYLTGPMHWLGLIDLASSDEQSPPKAFRLSSQASELLLGAPAPAAREENEAMNVLSNGAILVSRFTPRLARYQIARFGLWTKETDEAYTYLLTPTSLQAAYEQGLKISHLMTLLEKHAAQIPPNLSEALHQWEENGRQAQIEPAVILKVENPKMLQALRQSPASRFIGEPLGPTSAIINPDAIEKITDALTRLGYLSDVHHINITSPTAHKP